MIIATAGHVDHGKTSLVKALSGTDTDRLPEEKARRLTIDIGFAYMQTEDGQRIALIDVPGHKKYLRNMIAGVGLVDIALLVVAADDGPMPQTVEHIAILKLMGVGLVVPVISKADLADEHRLQAVKGMLHELLQSAEITATEISCVAVTDTMAVRKLRQIIFKRAISRPPRSGHGYFRMAIDRCFTLDGSGTVVTGTVVSGAIEKNQSVALLSNNPSHGKRARVRGIHAQNKEAMSANTGQRCALNLVGEVPRGDLRRGDWLATVPNPLGTKTVDVTLTPSLIFDTYSGGSALRHWTSARLHIGTASIPCRIALLDCTEVSRGSSAMARLICDREFFAAHGDRFVLRDQSANSTIAGGRVLDTLPPKRGRSKPERLEQLRALDVSSSARALCNLVELNCFGVHLGDFAGRFNLHPAEALAVAEQSCLIVVKSGSDSWCMHETQSESIKKKILHALLKIHSEHPDQPGVTLQNIQRLTDRKIDPGVVEFYLQELVKKAVVVRVASVFRHVDHQVTMTQSDSLLWSKVENELLAAASTPLRITELTSVTGREIQETQNFLNHCVAHGKLYKVTDNRYFLPQTLLGLALIAEELGAEDNLTVANFRNSSGVGRNLVVELLEYFDRCRFTQRIGNKRCVLQTANQLFSV